MPELLARIRANLRRVPLAPRESPEVLSFGEIEVNLGSRQVLVSGQDVHLRPKEVGVDGILTTG
jgi:DNA-binding response OmpR family regulator